MGMRIFIAGVHGVGGGDGRDGGVEVDGEHPARGSDAACQMWQRAAGARAQVEYLAALGDLERRHGLRYGGVDEVAVAGQVRRKARVKRGGGDGLIRK